MKLPRYDATRSDAPFAEALRAAMGRVLDRGVYLGGPETRALEAELLAWLGDSAPEAALGTGSGTDAIDLALRTLGVGPADEVLTVANAGVPGPTAITRVGATPVFCDVEARTALMNVRSAAAVRTSRTKAALVVHLYGGMVDVASVRAALPGVAIVEDCAQALGSELRGRRAGTLGDLAIFSFYPTKNLGGFADAGMLVGSDEGIARARRLADYGRDAEGVALERATMSRMDELSAAALRVKLARLDESLEARRALDADYDARLPQSVVSVATGEGVDRATHLRVVRSRSRATVRERLRARGIGTGVHYPVSAHEMPAFASPDQADLPVTRALCAEVLSLPFFVSMTAEEVSAVCDALAV